MDPQTLSITDNAAKRIAVLIKAEDNAAMMLRVKVSGGGCSGFQYAFSLDDQKNDDDMVFEQNNTLVVVDETSLELVSGSELDYVEDLIGSFFSLKNPNASSTCGCGNSFAI
jgi:iron-sulfur cluster insertion protein